MNLSDFLNTPTINKVIDQFPSDVINPLSNSPEVPKEVKDEQAVNQVSSLTLVQDGIESARELRKNSQDLYQEIVEKYKSIPEFQEYEELVRRSVWDPMQLEVDQSSRPDQNVDYSRINTLQQYLYRTVTDPRVPFLWDIRRVFAEAGITEYTLNFAWARLSEPEDFNLSFENERIIRMLILQEQSSLINKFEYLNTINRTPEIVAASTIIRGLAFKVNFYKDAPQDTIKSIQDTLNVLYKIRPLLRLALISSSYSWEKFTDTLEKIWGDYYQATIDRYTLSFSSRLGTVINQTVNDLISDFEDFAGVIPGEVIEIQEFRQILLREIQKSYADLESQLIQRQNEEMNTFNTRLQLLEETRKSTKVKQYIQGVEHLIEVLESLRDTLINGSLIDNLVFDNMILSAEIKLSKYRNRLLNL